MNPIKRILIGTDLSPYAARAEARAAMLARELGCEGLELVHVIGALPLEAFRHLLAETPLETEQRLVDSAREQLQETARSLGERYGIPVQTRIRIGRTHAEIVACADDIDAGLVVVGAHGGNFVRDLFLGATAEKVLRKTSRPLLVVRREPQAPYRRLLVPVDFSPASGRALELALAVAPGAEITLLHAFEVPFEGKLRFVGVKDEVIHHYRNEARQEASRSMEALLEAFKPEAARLTSRVEHGYPSSVIRKRAEELAPDLIVMGKHGQSELETMLLGSVTKHVLLETDCDMLVAQ